MNEPDDRHEKSTSGSKPATGRRSPRTVTVVRVRETQVKPGSSDLESAFHWTHFKDSR